MEIVRCNAGHFYDKEQHSECPICAGVKLPLMPEDPFDSAPEIPFNPAPEVLWGLGDDPGLGEIHADDGSRIYVMRDVHPRPKGFDPVMGWLVCIRGSMIGKSFELHRGYNQILWQENGIRVTKEGVPVDGEILAMIRFHDEVYDNACGCTSGPVEFIPNMYSHKADDTFYLNQRPVDTPHEIKNGDSIHISGFVGFLFVTFCDKHFNWPDQIPFILEESYEMGDVDPAKTIRKYPDKAWYYELFAESFNDRWMLLIDLPWLAQKVRICARSGHTEEDILYFMQEQEMLDEDAGEAYFRELGSLSGREPKNVCDFHTTALTLDYE